MRFLASPVNPSDVNQIQGVYPAKPRFDTSLGTTEPVAVGGNEGVAEVIATGAEVKTIQRGDWVIMARPGFGTWRTHASVPSEADVIRIDHREGITALQAGMLSINPCTAYRMLRDFVTLDADTGNWFIQNGANSGVGRAAIQLGRIWGYRSINVVRHRAGFEDLKRELLDLGATVVITEDELLDTRTLTHKLTNDIQQGQPPPKIRLALDCVGGKPATALAKTLADDGHLVTYGAMSKKPVDLPVGLLIFKNVTFHGFWVSRWGQLHPDRKKATVDDVLNLIRDGQLVDTPVRELSWSEKSTTTTTTDDDNHAPSSLEEILKKDVQGTLGGFRDAKTVFVF